MACPRKIAAAIALEVALQVTSVSRSVFMVFMTSQLYRVCLRCQSYQGTVKLTCVDCLVIRYDKILMLFRSTPSPPQVRLSVSELSPPRSPGFTAELNGPCVLRRRIRTEPKPTGSGPNHGSGRFGYYFGYLTTRVRVVNSGTGNPGTR